MLTPLFVFVRRWFWQVVEEMSSDKQRRLLLFVTGSDRMPVGGLSEMTFKIGKISSHRRNMNDLYVNVFLCSSLEISQLKRSDRFWTKKTRASRGTCRWCIYSILAVTYVGHLQRENRLTG